MEDKKEVLLSGICRTQLSSLDFSEESEVQYLQGNDVEVRGSVAAYVAKDYSSFKTLSPEVYPILDKIDATGKKVKRIDLFAGDITVSFDDDSHFTKKVRNALENVYALRKWFHVTSSRE